MEKIICASWKMTTHSNIITIAFSNYFVLLDKRIHKKRPGAVISQIPQINPQVHWEKKVL